jgi:hypothetical protein
LVLQETDGDLSISIFPSQLLYGCPKIDILRLKRLFRFFKLCYALFQLCYLLFE